MATFAYVGSELQAFSRATNWKNYYRRLIDEFLGNEVLEVGAGIGATTESLCKGRKFERWICLEPDAALASLITKRISNERLPSFCAVKIGTIQNIDESDRFDTILYIDVLEHIEEDAEEICSAVQRLKAGGHIVILSPAHAALYTPFDAGIGHFRRYNKRSLERAIPKGLHPRRVFYVDSVGMLASLGNKLLLKSATPTESQIAFWDRVLVPASKLVDPLLRFKLGKTIIGIWEKSAARTS